MTDNKDLMKNKMNELLKRLDSPIVSFLIFIFVCKIVIWILF